MLKVVLSPIEDGYWVAKCPSYPEFVSKGKTKREARTKFRNRIEKFEKYLDRVESNPQFIEMMKHSEADIRAGRVVTQEQAEKRFARRRKRRRTSTRNMGSKAWTKN
jgi:predicted RNase H-like HicB family nuclease